MLDRRPERFSPSRRPGNVPLEYVLTHNGFMHPSCVVAIGDDESVSHDGHVLGPDGAVRKSIAPCNYERYSGTGEVIAPQSPSEHPHLPPHATYDGWVVYYVYDGDVPAGATIKTDWIVPPAPAQRDSQDIAFFNDFTTASDVDEDILQPVLDWNSGEWSTESEHCCINGNDAYKGGGSVSEGDLIRGTVKGENCTAAGACSTWNIVTEDVTQGKSVTLTIHDAMGAPNSTHPAVLETYDVTNCNMLPASGTETFSNNSVTDSTGKVVSQPYTLGVISAREAPAGFPSCGYKGTTTGDNYTLIFSNSPVSSGGVQSSAGTTSTPGAGGVASMGGSASGGSLNMAGAAGFNVGGATTTGGAVGAGGTSALGGTSNGGANSSMGGRLIALGGTGVAGEHAAAGAAVVSAQTSSGCSCRAAGEGQRSTPVAPITLLGLVVTAFRRRRRSRP